MGCRAIDCQTVEQRNPPLDASSIQIADSEIAGSTSGASSSDSSDAFSSLSSGAAGEDDSFCLHFTRALILKTMTGAVEQTLWWQAGDLRIGGVERVEGELPQSHALCERGEIDDNQYTYRNMIPIPLRSRGHIRLELHLRDQARPLIVTGRAIALVLRETPKYIRHIRS
jgi:hypothetical protein